MSRIAIAFVVAAAFLFSEAASAQNSRTAYTGSLGVEVHRQEYREPSLDVSEKGWFGGLTADGIAAMGKWQLRADGRVAYGQMSYSGSGTEDGIDDFVFEGRILVARAIPIGAHGNGNRITPYFGYGYRRLYDNLGGHITSSGAGGYDRLSQYHYLPVGIEGQFRLSQSWAVKPTFEYDHLIQGMQDSYLSQAASGLGDLHNTQDSGWGLRGAIMFQTLMGSRPIEFGPFVRYWNIEQSDTKAVTFQGLTVGGGFEPANHTIEAGAALKVLF
jgi:hypothetical protein